MSAYWQNILNNRISRRRAIVATGATAASAAFLAACGGGSDDSSSGGTKDASGLRAKVEDTTGKAKNGGTWINPLAADVLGMDPYSVAIGSAHAPWGYSRLVRYNTAKYPE